MCRYILYQHIHIYNVLKESYMKNSKRLYIWSIVFSLLACAFYVYTVVMVVNNIDGFTDQIKTTLQEMYQVSGNDLNAILNTTVNYMIFIAVINGVAGIFAFVLIFLKDKLVYKLRVPIMIVSFAEMMAGMNLVSGLLMLFATKNLVNNLDTTFENFVITPTMTNEEVHEQLKYRNMTDRIELIKQLHERGALNDEQYKRLLDEIITNGINGVY